jgi:hypothetical protein
MGAIVVAVFRWKGRCLVHCATIMITTRPNCQEDAMLLS